jgi:hypothetical protein
MNRSSRYQKLSIRCVTLAAFLTASVALAAPCFLCRKPVLDTPISVAVGTIRTPEFPVKHEAYTISIQVERKFAPAELNCMMGVKPFAWVQDHCGMLHIETLLEAEWTVWDGDHSVAHGSVSGINSSITATKELLSKQIGDFVGEKNKRYILEIKFTRDGTPLNVTNPHLVVMMTKPTDI